MTTGPIRSQQRVPRVFLCATCGRLAATRRTHTLTCSGACRVALHRHPAWIRELRTVAAALNLPVSGILDRKAIERLRPDLAVRIQAGDLTAEGVRVEVWQAYQQLLLDSSRTVKSPRGMGETLHPRASGRRQAQRPRRDTTSLRDRHAAEMLQRMKSYFRSHPTKPSDADR